MITTLTTGPKKPVKNEMVESYRLYHSTLLQDEGVTPIHFYPKMAYAATVGDHKSKVVGVFESELARPEGFYLEIIENQMPVDSKRTVYKITHRPNFADVYTKNPNSGAYNVPLEDLEVVERKKMKELDPSLSITESDLDVATDGNINSMTIMDLAAILWQKPVSEKSWLNDQINKLEG